MGLPQIIAISAHLWQRKQTDKLKEEDKSAPDLLQWTPLGEEAFTALKQALASTPALGRPDYKKPIILYHRELQGVASGVRTQPFSDKQRPVGYYSALLDPVAQGMPTCLRPVASAAYPCGASG
ncbi:hypothetical protein NDU88_007514 [Pleurodeles waltl]|uniref:Reverse transcriptase/retrotransposon-derived protein RNase H-like domain-containing protein n=1 Tax=Pleurodeles waltl TaxID=8319 RepID=A0AAV7U089_PLEWA|nr:hypothetical protein NDU88_007514 [Pleurodeles waltl]